MDDLKRFIGVIRRWDSYQHQRLAANLETAAPAEVGALLCGALEDPNQWVREQAVLLLGSRRDPAALQPLCRLLREDEEWHVRSAAAGALGNLGDAAAVPVLLLALEEAEEWVRVQAVVALGALRAPDAYAAFCRAMQDPSPEVCARAAENLGLLGDPRAVAPLAEVLDREGNLFRLAVVQALGFLGREAVPPLLKVLGDPDLLLRLETAVALERIVQAAGEPAGSPPPEEATRREYTAGLVPGLCRVLEDPLPQVRLCAVRTLDHITQQSPVFELRGAPGPP